MLSVVYAECCLCWVLFMLSVVYAECCYAECRCTECYYAECRGALRTGPNVIKNFVHNLRVFVISWSVCLFQLLPAQPNGCGWGQEPILEWSIWEVPHSFRLQPYLQTLDKARRLARVKHFSLLRKSVNYEQKSFIKLDPGQNVIKFFMSVISEFL